MPVMKLPTDVGTTAWIPFPHTVFSIADEEGGGCRIFMDPHPHNSAEYVIKGQSARDIKRSIQENTEEHIGFLKLSVGATTRKMYVNIFYVESLESISATKAQIRIRGGGNVNLGTLKVTADPTQLAYQLRRIVKRLEQDEEFCCEAPAEEEEAE